MKTPILLLTGAFNYSAEQFESLKNLGFNIVFAQQEAEPLPAEAHEAMAVVCNGLFLHHNIEDFPNLKLIQLTSAGLDRVPIDKIEKREIKLLNARGVYGIPMAEWALCKALEYFKGGKFFHHEQEQKRWTKNRNLKEIFGSKVGIIGAGNVGQEVAKRFKALGARITGFDIHSNPTEGFDQILTIELLPSKIGDFDIWILTAPLLPSTRGIIDRDKMIAMKKDSLIINISRGPLIDELALIDVLNTRKDLHAALDVFTVEPLPAESPLWAMENVTISPHNSFVGNGNNERMFNVIYSNLKNLMIELN